MGIVEQHFYHSEKVKDDVTHLNESVPSELTETFKKYQPLIKIIRVFIIMLFSVSFLMMASMPIIAVLITFVEDDPIKMHMLFKVLIIGVMTGVFFFISGAILSYLSDRYVSQSNIDTLNTQMMNKDGQVVRLYKLIDAKNSRVGRLLFDVQEYRYFVKDIPDLDEREIVKNSCKVPKISHNDAYNLIMTIQDMAILTEHEKIAEDEKQSEREKRKHQEKLDRMKSRYQKVNQFSKDDLDNMTDIQTLKAMEDKIQNIRKNEEKTIESWLNNGK